MHVSFLCMRMVHPEDARVQSSEAVELVRSMKNTTPKPITQVAVLADYDVFLGLSG